VFRVMLGAVLRRFLLVMLSLKVVAVRDMRVMVALGVIAFFVGLGGLFMMMLRMAVVLGGLAVMLG
jgi:hypothetical protein